MKRFDLRAAVLLLALFTFNAVAGFQQINRGMVNQATVVTNSATTTTFTATSNQVYIFEGTTTQTAQLPDATLLPIDWWYRLVNNSNSTVSILDGAGAALQTLTTKQVGNFHLTARATSAGTWKKSIIPSVNSVGSIVGNALTADALSADPTDCPSGQFANGIDVYGNLTCSAAAGTGSVVGPLVSTDKAIARWNGIDGFFLQDSGATISDLGAVSAPSFVGPLTGNVTGNVSGNAGTVTTNANLTGPITSVGNATSIGAQTGTGSTFVVDTSPTIVTPTIAKIANLTTNGYVKTSGGNGTLGVQAVPIPTTDGGTGTVDPTTDWLSQYLLLAGRSGGQIAIGGTAASNSLTLKSTSNATVGSVIISPQALEKTQIGPTGSTTVWNDKTEIMVPNTNSLSNGVVIHSNELNYPATHNNQASPNGFGIFPHDAGGEFLLTATTSGAGLMRVYRSTDGLSLGYMSLGTPWGFMNSNAGLVAFKVSGTTGQSVDLQDWSKTSDYGSVDASVGSTGEFRGPAGLVTKDTYGLQGTTGIGMYFPSTSSIGFSVGGAQQMSLAAAGMTTPNIIHTPVAIPASDINWQSTSLFTKVLSANTTFTFSNANAGQTILVKVINPSTYTVTFPNTLGGNTVHWKDSVPPVATTGSNARSIYSIFFDGTDYIGTFNGGF